MNPASKEDHHQASGYHDRGGGGGGQKSFMIAGHSVYFPYQPYPSQFAMMDKVIKALSRKENALLESATGTGKSLALLCASLAWQMGEKERLRNEQLQALQQGLNNEYQLNSQHSQSTQLQSQIDPETPNTTQQTQYQQDTSQSTQLQSHIDQDTPNTTQQTTQYSQQDTLQQQGYGCEGTGPPNNPTNEYQQASQLISTSQHSNNTTSEYQQASQLTSTSQHESQQDTQASEPSQSSQPSPEQFQLSPILNEPSPSPPKPPPSPKETNQEIIYENDDDDDFAPTPVKKPSTKRKEKKPPKPTKSSTKGKRPKKNTPTTTTTTSTTLIPPIPSLNDDKSKVSSNPPHLPAVKAPTIYFGTRTHTQVAQLVAELGRTLPKMSVLASRDHYCLHPVVSKSSNKNSDCKKIVSDENCLFDKGIRRLANSSALVDKVWDIEDLVKLGSKLIGCPYYASRGIAKVADIVFCPYNYIIDPSIRDSMGIDLKGAAIVFDEAHNIEDVMMGVASGDFDFTDLSDGIQRKAYYKISNAHLELLKQLTTCALIPEFREVYGPTQNMIACIVDWLNEAIQTLKPTDFETHTNYWSGDEFVATLSRAGVNVDNFEQIIESVMAIDELSSPINIKPGSLKTAKALVILQDLLKVLRFLFSEGLAYTLDFRIVIQKASRHKHGKSFWTHSLGRKIWCMSPRVAYKALESARATILTSGTLSPMDSYASELGANFEQRAELGHVIDTNRQLWAAAISRGPGGQPIKAVFQNSDSLTAQDVIGDTILAFLGCIPGGVLCFFPSYTFLDKLVARWQVTGLWARMQGVKEMFVEPKGSTGDFSPVLSSYYRAADTPRGGALLAVCRGKVSEGLDFTDHYARGVLVVGIPYPSLKDLRVVLKRTYNDQNQIARGLVDGRNWYQLQAFRALNQALGRCIRHRNDYGCILLIDERFNDQAVIGKLSKWVRGNVRTGASVEQATTNLESFFATHKQQQTLLRDELNN